MKKILIPLLLGFVFPFSCYYAMASNADNLSIKDAVVPIKQSAEEMQSTPLNQEELILLIEKQNETIQKITSDVQKIQYRDNGITFPIWTSILLGCVAILVTVLGVIIAIISFVGYRNFEQSAKKTSEQISEATATRIAQDVADQTINQVAKDELARLIDEGELTRHLESAVDMIVRKKSNRDELSGFNKYPELDEE